MSSRLYIPSAARVSRVHGLPDPVEMDPDHLEGYLRACAARAVRGLLSAGLQPDPLFRDRDARVAVIQASAQRRHGPLIEAALAATVAAYADHRYTVYRAPQIHIAEEVDRIVSGAKAGLRPDFSMSYRPRGRIVRPDLVLFDRVDGVVHAIEVKRGGTHGAGPLRALRRDLDALSVVLRDWAAVHGLEAEAHAVRCLSWRGDCGVGQPWSMDMRTFDALADSPASAAADYVTEAFAAAVRRVIALLPRDHAGQSEGRISGAGA